MSKKTVFNTETTYTPNEVFELFEIKSAKKKSTYGSWRVDNPTYRAADKKLFSAKTLLDAFNCLAVLHLEPVTLSIEPNRYSKTDGTIDQYKAVINKCNFTSRFVKDLNIEGKSIVSGWIRKLRDSNGKPLLITCYSPAHDLSFQTIVYLKHVPYNGEYVTQINICYSIISE